MKVRTRLLAMMLAIVMIISILPVGALAGNAYGHYKGKGKDLPADGASNSVVVIAGSDFQDPGDNDANASASSNNVKSILNQIKIDYATADALIFCGDYDKDLPSTDVQKSTTALKNAVKSVFSDVDDFFLVQGNHDQVTQGTNGLTGPGAHDTTDYGVYIIDEDDYQWSSGANEGKIKTTAASLKSYLNGKISAGYTKPIFVASHVPLHFSPRTQEGDGKYAKYIFDELQAGGAAGLNIIFLYGHDHSQGWDNYMGGAAVYLPKGHDINIANVGSGTVYGTYTLNFNYMNAGFVGYYADWEPETDYKNKDSGVDKTKTMSVFEITDSEVTVKRYDENGVHVLKSEGKENVKHTTRTQCPLMTDVLTSPQTISLTSVPPVNPPETDDTVYTGTYEYAASAEAGKEYLLVSNGYALQNDNGVVSAAKVKENDDGTVSVDETASEASLLWEFNASSFASSGDFTVSNDGLYVGRESGDAEQAMELLGTNDTYYTAWSYEDGSVLRQVSGSSSDYTFYAYARNGSFYVNHSEDIDEAGYDYTLKLYEKAAEPEEPTAETFTDDATGIKVTTTSGTGLEVALGSTEETYAFLSEYVAYDITVTDFVQGTDATVSIPLPAGYDADKTVVYYRADNGELTDMNATVENGVVTFITTHFSTYMVGQTSVNIGNWVKVEIPGETKHIYTLDTNGIDEDSEYLIVANQSDNCLTWSGKSTFTPRAVTISNNKITLDTNAYNLKFNSTGTNTYTLTHGDNYFRVNVKKSGNNYNYSFRMDDGDNYRNWTVTHKGSGVYSIVNTNTNRGINLSASNITTSNGSSDKRLFKYTPETTVAETYYLGMVSETPYSFPTSRFANPAELENYLKTQIKVVKADDTNGTNAQFVNYTLTPDNTVNPTAVGNVTYTVAYNGHTVGTVSVNFTAVTVTSMELTNNEGTVVRGAKATEDTGAKLTVHYSDGSSEEVPITLGMITDGRNLAENEGDYANCTVNYNGEEITGFTLHVIPNPDENDYPEYPDGGSVRVGKSGTPIDWYSTGVAKIELSATGIPVNKGVDVIVMLDTSSSMNYGATSGTSAGPEGRKRIDYLHNSLTTMLEKFTTPNEDGSAPDIRLAMADFNGYTLINNNDRIGNSAQTQTQVTGIFTGDNTISAGAFEQVGEYTDSDISTLVNKIQPHSGTNFDYAFDTVYRLAYAIKEENENNGEDRELYVIFMSDGCPYQYNYFTSQSSVAEWNSWLTGKNVTITGSENNVTATIGSDLTDPSTIVYSGSNHKYFYNAATNNTHRMADAIKGSVDETFEVISTSNTSFPGGTKVSGKDYMYTVNGLGATVYSIGFCLYDDKKIDSTSIETTISRTATDRDHFFKVQGTDEDINVQAKLDNVFTQIASEIKEAATNARFVDTMGAEYDLQMSGTAGSGVEAVNLAEKGITPAIEVKEYEVYKKSDVGKTINGKTVTEDMVGNRKDSGTVIERVVFGEGGAYIDGLVGGGNILKDDGVIYANKFWYNTNKTKSVSIDTDGDGTKDYSLAPETFYWKIGTIREKEYVLSYYVYLTGTFDEDERLAGIYPTNKDATLYYTNWLNHDAQKGTVSPKFPWGQATVNYAYYLVDSNGNPIVNSSGDTGSFANRVRLTDPVNGGILELNEGFNGGTITLGFTGANALTPPEGYILYDNAASYSVYVSSDNTDYWRIVKGNDVAATTYVTDYGDGVNYSNKLNENSTDYIYTNTTVWFALTYKPRTNPDVVVIDYGLPVDISVLANDMFGKYGTLDSIGMTWPTNSYTDKAAAKDASFASTLTLDYGSAAVRSDGKIRYTPANMQMPDTDKFYYAAKYEKGTDNANNGYYYADVTVIPATIIYYEDTFVTFSEGWEDVTSSGSSVTQAEDRPGKQAISGIDANNVYGFDAAYANCTMYSNGAAKMTTVGLGDYPTATFTYTGSGFDIISLTSKATGTIKVKVYEGTEATGTAVKTWAVDTYYGYTEVKKDDFIKTVWYYDNNVWRVESQEIVADKYINDGEENVTEKGLPSGNDIDPSVKYVIFDVNYEWVVTNDTDNALYQIPVLKSYDKLPYGTYTVVVSPIYSDYFEHVDGSSDYDFYFDAVRVYGPANSDSDEYEEIVDAYKADNEAYPEFIEIRENLIGQEAFSDDKNVTGAVFIDAFGTSGDISEYTQFGPNNEVYLKSGQSIAFKIASENTVVPASIQISAKSVNTASKLQIECNGKTQTIDLTTSTDRYYDIMDIINLSMVGGSGLTSETVVITNVGSGIASLTNIKLTHDRAPAAKTTLTMNRQAALAAVNMLQMRYVEEHSAPESETPVIVEPEVFEPAKISVSVSGKSFKVGDTVSAAITTSSDVASLTLNGIAAKLKKTDKKTGEKTWTVSVKASAVGDMILSVVAYDSEGVASEPIQSTITVTAKNGNGKKAKP